MKNIKGVRQFFGFTIMAALVLVVYNNCSRKSEGTVTGNPMAPVATKLVTSICGVLNRCYPQVELTNCQSGVMNTEGFSTRLGLPKSYDTLTAITAAEREGSLTGNLSAGNTCGEVVNTLDCADPLVSSAYNATAANPFENTPQLLQNNVCTQSFVSAPMVYAKSASFADVSAAVESAKSGDTVIVPAGTATWSNQLFISKGINLLGAGIDSTVITSNIRNAYNGHLINFVPSNPALNETFELSGFTFDGGMDANAPGSGILFISSNSSEIAISNLKVHDNKFKNAYSRAISLQGLEFGVFYKNEFLDNYISISVVGAEINGWNYPLVLGGVNYPYFEDNTFTQTKARGGLITSVGRGGRLVFRNNTISGYGGSGGELWDSHGADNPPLDNGTVAVEYYNNNISVSMALRLLHHRGGKALVFNNSVSGGSSPSYMHLTEYQGWSFCTSEAYPKTQQINESFYWNNSSNAQSIAPSLLCSSSDPSCTVCNPKQFDDTYIQLDRDYWLPTSGLESAKGNSCVPNSHFAATDTGNLYRCSAFGVWTLYYSPYIYPHPRRSAH